MQRAKSRTVRRHGRYLLPLHVRQAGHRPRVGLLSIGEEETKGNDLTREAFHLLKQLPLNFVGNVEGRDLYNGQVDVIVADGFVGNVALKISEGVANLVRTALKESLKATITRQVGALLSRSAFTDFKKRLDHTEYGGAPLLGVKGVCIITHGSSNANAIKNAMRVAAEFSETRNQPDRLNAAWPRCGQTARRSTVS